MPQSASGTLHSIKNERLQENDVRTMDSLKEFTDSLASARQELAKEKRHAEDASAKSKQLQRICRAAAQEVREAQDQLTSLNVCHSRMSHTNEIRRQQLDSRNAILASLRGSRLEAEQAAQTTASQAEASQDAFITNANALVEKLLASMEDGNPSALQALLQARRRELILIRSRVASMSSLANAQKAKYKASANNNSSNSKLNAVGSIGGEDALLLSQKTEQLQNLRSQKEAKAAAYKAELDAAISERDKLHEKVQSLSTAIEEGEGAFRAAQQQYNMVTEAGSVCSVCGQPLEVDRDI